MTKTQSTPQEALAKQANAVLKAARCKARAGEVAFLSFGSSCTLSPSYVEVMVGLRKLNGKPIQSLRRPYRQKDETKEQFRPRLKAWQAKVEEYKATHIAKAKVALRKAGIRFQSRGSALRLK